MKATTAASRTVAVALAAIAFTACGRHPSRPAVTAKTAVAVPSRIVTAVTVPVYAESPGSIAPAESVRVASRLTGFVRNLDVDVGDHVTAGMPLLTIDDKDIEAHIARARADLDAAQATYANADFNYQRYSNLYRQEAVSRQHYEAAKRDYAAARASMSSAEAVLAQAEANRAYAQVRAPYAGVVIARYVDAGDLATPGKPLLAIEASGGLEVRTQVTNAAFRKLALGEQVAVLAASAPIPAKVSQISPAANPMTDTHLVKLALPTNSGLVSGSYVRVLVPVGFRSALLVPPAAITHRAGIPGVFVIATDGRAHLRMVRIGERFEGQVEITAGLTAGERIVSRVSDAIDNGTPVSAEPENGPQ